jgi:hypothetical protein
MTFHVVSVRQLYLCGAFLFLLCLAPGATVFAVDIYVSPSGSGSSCSSGSPCTFAQAISVSTAGDVIHAYDGTYTGDG